MKYILSLTSVFILAIALLSLIRTYGVDALFSDIKPIMSQTDLKNNARTWLEAIKHSDGKRALAAASALVPDNNVTALPPSEYAKMASDFQIPISALDGPFNTYDFLYWRSCAELAAVCEKEKLRTAESIFKFIQDNVKLTAPSQTTLPFAIDILHRKEASDIDKIRLACGLAAQYGLPARIIGFRTLEGNFVYFMCEIREGRNSSILDFRTNKIIKISADGLLDSRELKISIGSAGISQENIIIIQPSEFFDYRRCNIKLGTALKNAGLTVSLGIDPEQAIDSYPKVFRDQRDFTIQYWALPFMAFRNLSAKAQPLPQK